VRGFFSWGGLYGVVLLLSGVCLLEDIDEMSLFIGSYRLPCSFYLYFRVITSCTLYSVKVLCLQ
jgi:hypothetical protein